MGRQGVGGGIFYMVPMKKSKRKDCSEKRFYDAAPKMARWLLCQQVGLVLYRSSIPNEALVEFKSDIERSLHELGAIPKLRVE